MCDIGDDGVGKNEKLIERVKGLPKDLTFDEVVRLLSGFGYIQKDKGKPVVPGLFLYTKNVRQFCCTNHIRARNCLYIRSGSWWIFCRGRD